VSIDVGPIATGFQDLRDKLNGGINTVDVNSAAAGNFARPRLQARSPGISRLDTAQGFIVHQNTITPSDNPDTSWVLIDGTHKSGDVLDTGSPDHLDVALYGQPEYQWVPGATARFYVPYNADVRVHVEADVVVPANASMARTAQLGLLGGPQLQVPSYSALFTVTETGGPSGPRAPDQASHEVAHFLDSATYGIFPGTPNSLPGEPTPQVSGDFPETPFWFRRRHTSTRLDLFLDGGRWYTWGLRINPRADRVYVGSRTIHLEARYR